MLDKERLSYWDTLGEERRPIVLYGTGNGADKIIDACESYGIRLSGVFASDGFVRDRVFRDMRVLSYSEVRERFGDDIVVLPAFGSTRDEVLDFFDLLDARHELIIPEVPLYGGGIFDARHYSLMREKLSSVFSMLSDDYSRELFCDAVDFRLTGKLGCLKRCESVESSLRSMPFAHSASVCLDGGAFRGDSAQDMLSAFPNVKRIIALEPDPATYKRLCAFADGTNGVVFPVNSALGNFVGVRECVSSGSRGSGISGKSRRARVTSISCDTVDRLCENERLDFLKLDVEGFESDALEGARESITRDRCAVSVSLYHKTDDLAELPLLLKEMLGDCDMYLRRPRCVPMWDLTLYVCPRR